MKATPGVAILDCSEMHYLVHWRGLGASRAENHAEVKRTVGSPLAIGEGSAIWGVGLTWCLCVLAGLLACAPQKAVVVSGAPNAAPQVAADTTAASPKSTRTSSGFAWSVMGTFTQVTLMGSIHVGFDGLYPLPEPMLRAFRESTTLAMELALDKEPPERVTELLVQSATLPKGQTLHDCLSEQAWLRYQEFAARHEDQAKFFNGYRPWFVAIFLSGEKSELNGYDPNKGLDLYFFNQRGSRRVVGVEKAQDHVRALAELPAATQELMLLEQLDAMKQSEDELASVVQFWKAGDADGLAQEMFGQFDDPRYAPVYDALIVKRNENMTKQIETWLAGKERVFVVLGAGHFVGKDGIVARLTHDGWVPHRL